MYLRLANRAGQFLQKIVLDICLMIEKKGNGVKSHDKKSLYAQGKSKSKGTALVLLFFISNAQWALQNGANVLKIIIISIFQNVQWFKNARCHQAVYE